MNNTTYSIIIPHHNTPVLLKRLVDSIPQREDIEIIVVDDNSDADKKADVKRPGVTTIFVDKDHTGGAGKARNTGMDNAHGKWLLFADADDFYLDGFIDILDEYTNHDVDYVFFDIISVDGSTLKKDNQNRSRRNNTLIDNYDGSKEHADELLFLSWSPWNKMIRKEYIDKYHFRYEEVTSGNDVFFSFQIGYFSKRFEVIKQKLYALTYTPGSITYKKKNFAKTLTGFLNGYKVSQFFKFINHPEWNNKSIIRKKKYLPIRTIFGLIKLRPNIGLRILLYYLLHYVKIQKQSMYYVETIKAIEKMFIL